jgi:hypothetical protein
LETYGYAVTAHITPRLGDLTVAEAKPARLQPFPNRVEKESGAGAAKNCGMIPGTVQTAAKKKRKMLELPERSEALSFLLRNLSSGRALFGS